MIKISEKSDCCGCTACSCICSHHAISMEEDVEGFLYPKVSLDKCVECGLCLKVCPIISQQKDSSSTSYKKLYAVRLSDDKLLMDSASGGAFTAIALYVLSCGGFVVGADYDDNMVVAHKIINNYNDLDRLKGSKYSQSDIQGIFPKIKHLLKQGRMVLFSGTPCQVHALQLFLRKFYDNLITVDIVCHAVASPKVFGDFIRYAERALGSGISSLKMRDKELRGWGHTLSYRYFMKDGTQLLEPAINTWGTIFFSEMISRPSCHECKYCNMHRKGDFTMGDFWDDKKLRPDIYSNKGTSVLFLNTEKAVQLFECFKERLEVYEVSEKESWQWNLEWPTVASKQRSVFWADYHKYGFEKTYDKYFVPSVWKRIKRKIKRML